MKALTIHQPWASLLARGAKRFETRSWATNYRGPIAIHASKKRVSGLDVLRMPVDAVADGLGVCRPCDTESSYSFWEQCLENEYYGAIIASAELIGCWLIYDCTSSYGTGYGAKGIRADGGLIITPCCVEYQFGNFTTGRYAWEFSNMTLLPDPIPAAGRQGLWNWHEP